MVLDLDFVGGCEEGDLEACTKIFSERGSFQETVNTLPRRERSGGVE